MSHRTSAAIRSPRTLSWDALRIAGQMTWLQTPTSPLLKTANRRFRASVFNSHSRRLRPTLIDCAARSTPRTRPLEPTNLATSAVTSPTPQPTSSTCMEGPIPASRRNPTVAGLNRRALAAAYPDRHIMMGSKAQACHVATVAQHRARSRKKSVQPKGDNGSARSSSPVRLPDLRLLLGK